MTSVCGVLKRNIRKCMLYQSLPHLELSFQPSPFLFRQIKNYKLFTYLFSRKRRSGCIVLDVP